VDDARAESIWALTTASRRRIREGLEIMGILAWLAVGLIAGLIAKAIMPGAGPGGIIMTILLGIGGAIVGGFLSTTLGIGGGINNFDVGTVFLAVVGAVLLLFGYSVVSRGAHT
jgi:uncharacterized membrane protein YeaQ/YmgE (transglycosylase-associated protein family)